ncbi:MAG: hypothetical protein IM638_18665 [Bacteroidetes bacterium]|nr:hypothetical protein [Bacteroidota bacterium]
MNRLLITSFLVFVALAGSITAMAYTGSKAECKETGSCCKKEAAVSGNNNSCHSNAEMQAGTGEAKPCCKKK